MFRLAWPWIPFCFMIATVSAGGWTYHVHSQHGQAGSFKTFVKVPGSRAALQNGAHDIKLRILDELTNQPIPGVKVTINGESKVTNSDGEVCAKKGLSGPAKISVDRPEGFCGTNDIEMAASEGNNTRTISLKPLKDGNNLWECVTGEDLITPLDLQGQSIEEVVSNIAQKVDAPGQPKGEPFKRIQGPKHKNTKIGIVGAGPAGIHMAYSLKLMGYTDVTILEKTNRLGGKSQTLRLRNTEQILTTVLFTKGHYNNTMIPLFEKFGFLTPGSVIKSKREDTIIWSSNDKKSENLNGPQSNVKFLMGYFNSTDVQTVTKLFIKDLVKYINLHWKLFGKYDFNLMRRPEDKNLPLLQGTFMEFLKKNDLLSLTVFMRTSITVLGYGTLETVPLIYGLIWASPSLVVDQLTGDRIFYLKEKTFTQLFEVMAKDQNLNIKYNYEVTDINKVKGGSKYQLTSQSGDQDQFDFLIWAGLPQTLGRLSKPKSIVGKGLQEILDGSKHHTASVSVVEVKNLVKKARSQFFAQPLSSPTYDNSVMIDWDTHAASLEITPQEYAARNFAYNDSSPSSGQLTFTVFQYCYCTPSIYDTQKKLLDHYDQGFDGDNVEIISTKAFDYHPRWNVENAAKGYHWDLYDHQGVDNIWVIGGGTVFDSTSNVVGYNQLLLQSMSN